MKDNYPDTEPAQFQQDKRGVRGRVSGGGESAEDRQSLVRANSERQIDESVKRVALMATPGYCNLLAKDKEHIVRVLAALEAAKARCNFLVDENRKAMQREVRVIDEQAAQQRVLELERVLEWYADSRTWNQWLPESASDRARKALGRSS